VLLSASTWRFAWRNVGRNPRRTAIVVTAVAVGVGGILLTMAVNYGMVHQMVETAIGTELGHIQVHGQGFEDDPSLDIRIEPERGVRPGWAADLPDVRAWAPRVRSQGLVFSPRASVGVRLIGIDPEREAEVSVLAESLVEGSFLTERRRLLMGERLARRLHVAVGDKVVVSAQDVSGDMTGEAFRVSGLFRTASRELDEGAVFVRIDEGQRLLGLGEAISELVVLAEADRDLEALRTGMEQRLGEGLEVRTWQELRPILVHMIDLFDSMGWIVYAAVFVAMAFGIANVLLMSVFDRVREIGILMAIGMPPSRLVVGVVIESLILTGFGLLLGFALGLGSVALLRDGIDLSGFGDDLSAYGIGNRIVPVLRAADIWVPIVVALVTAFLASLWPALRAVRTRPAEAVRQV